MSAEEKKLFLLTRFNTTINRDDPEQRDFYMRKCNNFYNIIYFIVYSKIYGDKGEKLFNSLKKTNTKKEKKKVNVSFSGAVEISRN